MKTYIKIIFIVFMMFTFSHSVTNQDKNLEKIQELSTKEDAKSQFELGKIYQIDNNDTQLNQKYEDIKQIIINQHKNMEIPLLQ